MQLQRSDPMRIVRTTRSYRAGRPAVPRPLPRRRRPHDGLRAFASALGALALVGALVGMYELSMADSVYPGVRLGGVDVSGLSRAAALTRLRAAGDLAATTYITLRAAGATGRAWDVTPARLGFALDVPASVDTAYRLGRVGDPLQRLRAQGRLLLGGRALALTGTYDARALTAYLHRVAATLNRPARSAALSLTPAGPRLDAAARDGLSLDVARATAVLAAALAAGQPTTVWLPLRVTRPAVSTAAAFREETRLARRLATPVIVAVGTRAWTLAPADIAALLRLMTARRGRDTVYADVVDYAAVADYVARQAAPLDRDGRDATVHYQGGVVRVIAGRDGSVIDRTAAVAALVTALSRADEATATWPTINGPTVSNAEAAATAARLRRILRTAVVWLPRRHWALTPASIAGALRLRRIPHVSGALLTPRLDTRSIAAALLGSRALASAAARDAAVITRGGRGVVVPAIAGHRPNYEALVAEMLAAPAGRAVYHLPIATYDPAVTTAMAVATARARRNVPRG